MPLDALKPVFGRKVQFDFLRGRQMIVYDPRAPGLLDPEAKICAPAKLPAAMNTFKVSAADKMDAIVGWIATVAKGDTGKKKLDALHIYGHGNPTYVQLGADGVCASTLPKFGALKDLVRGAVVFHSCSVAGYAFDSGFLGIQIGQEMAIRVKCPTLAAVSEQLAPTVDGRVDLSNFEGLVVEFRPDKTRRVHNVTGGFDMSTVIFRS